MQQYSINQEQLLSRLRHIRLAGFAEALSQQWLKPMVQDLSFEERLDLLLSYEMTCREGRKIKRLVQQATLRQEARSEEISYTEARGINKAEVNSLLRELRPSPSVPVMTDLGHTSALIRDYATSLWLSDVKHEVFGFVLLPRTRFLFSRGLVECLHERGMRVLVCGEDLSREETLRECLDYGVDILLTDRPDLLGKIITEASSSSDTL